MSAPAARPWPALGPALLAGGWALVWAFVTAALAPRAESTHAVGATVTGVVLLAARALAWGSLPAILFPRGPIFWPTALAAIGELMVRSAGHGPGLAGPAWPAPLFLAGTIPAQLFARWTREGRRLEGRAVLHVISHAGLLLVVLPGLLVEAGAGGWEAPWARAAWINKIAIQALLVPAVLLLASVGEFVRAGGTPAPVDPPRTLVRTGPYAYLANPIQVGKALLVAGWGLFWGNRAMLAAAGLAVAYSVLVAAPREETEMRRRFGRSWTEYRRQMRRWWPRWRPLPSAGPAVLFLDLGCAPCGRLASWLAARRPAALELRPLPPTDATSQRMLYRAASGHEDAGLAALARALEHVHLGWALLAWGLLVPGVRTLLELVAEVSGPRRELSAGAESSACVGARTSRAG